MPTSYPEAISSILELVRREKPRSILDLGVGFGKYGMLCREMLDIPFERYSRETWQIVIDGVEGYAKYRNPIHDYVYNRVIYEPIQQAIKTLGVYDVTLLIDVLEHFEQTEGEGLIKEILEHTAKVLIVSTPRQPAKQTAYLDNTLEAHLSAWTPADLQRLGGKVFEHPCGALIAVFRADHRRLFRNLHEEASPEERMQTALLSAEAGDPQAIAWLCSQYQHEPDTVPVRGVIWLARYSLLLGDIESTGAFIVDAFQRSPNAELGRLLLQFCRDHAPDHWAGAAAMVLEHVDPSELIGLLPEQG